MVNLFITNSMFTYGAAIILFFIAICFTLALISYTTDILILEPRYWIFNVGIQLNRYEEYTEDYDQGRVRKELVIGLLVIAIRINFIFMKELVDAEEENEHSS